MKKKGIFLAHGCHGPLTQEDTVTEFNSHLVPGNEAILRT